MSPLRKNENRIFSSLRRTDVVSLVKNDCSFFCYLCLDSSGSWSNIKTSEQNDLIFVLGVIKTHKNEPICFWKKKRSIVTTLKNGKIFVLGVFFCIKQNRVSKLRLLGETFHGVLRKKIVIQNSKTKKNKPFVFYETV